MLTKVMDLFEEAGANIKSIIVQFTTFCHKTMVYRAMKNMKGNVLVKSDKKTLKRSYFCK